MIKVKATREGLIGHTTASGFVIDATTPFVALPSNLALRQFVQLYNSATNRWCRALVLDVGPWNTDDHGYVLQPATIQRLAVASPPYGVVTALPTPVYAIRPQAETGTDTRGRTTNGAGIDLGEAVWNALGMTDNGEVEWEFY